MPDQPGSLFFLVQGGYGGDVHDVGRGSFHSRRPSLNGRCMSVSDPREYGTLGVGRHDNPALSAFRWRGPGSHQPTPLRACHPRLAENTPPNRDMPTKWIHPLVLKNTEAGSMRCAGVRPQTELPLAPGPAGDCARFERGCVRTGSERAGSAAMPLAVQ